MGAKLYRKQIKTLYHLSLRDQDSMHRTVLDEFASFRQIQIWHSRVLQAPTVRYTDVVLTPA